MRSRLGLLRHRLGGVAVWLVTLSASLAWTYGGDIVGSWDGSFRMGKFSMRTVLKIAEAEDGTLSATMSYPDRGVRGLKVDAILYNEPDLYIEFNQMGGGFRGSFDFENEVLNGKWDFGNQQGPPMKRDMEFRRLENDPDVPETLVYEADAKSLPGQGMWRGTLKVNKDVSVGLVLRVGQTPTGKVMAYIDIPDQGAKDLTVQDLKLNESEVAFGVPAMGMKFSGEVASDRGSISGRLAGGPQSFEVTFERLESLDELAGPVLSYDRDPEVNDARGYWLGTLDIQGTTLRMGLAIGRAADGSFQGTLDSLDQNVRGIRMSEVSIEGTKTVLKWSAIGATYTGTVSDDGEVLEGEFQQGPITSPLSFSRQTGPAEEEE